MADYFPLVDASASSAAEALSVGPRHVPPEAAVHHLTITIIKRIRTSRLSIKKSFSLVGCNPSEREYFIPATHLREKVLH